MNPETDDTTRTLVAEANRLVPNGVSAITTGDEYGLYGERLKMLRKMERQLDARRKEMTKPLDEAKRSIIEFFREPIGRLQSAADDYDRAMRAWHAEEERRRREAERAAAEAARKERERIEREAAMERARAEEQARKAREKAEEAARKLEERGRAEQAEARRRAAEQAAAAARAAAEAAEEAKRNQAAMIPEQPVVETERVKVQGVHRRKTWKWRVIDPVKVPREYLLLDEVKIGKVVRALGADTNIDGIEVYEDSSIVTRTS